MLKNEFIIEEKAEGLRWFYTFKGKNNKKETLVIEVSKIHHDAAGLPKVWKNAGYTNKLITDYWSVHTYAEDPEGNCRGRYNPQIKTEKYTEERRRYKPYSCDYDVVTVEKARNVLNFDWLLEPTEENLDIILQEILNRYLA